MRQLKKQMIILVIGSFILLAVSLAFIFHFEYKSGMEKAEGIKAKANLDIAEAIIDLRYPGPWSVKGAELYKGQTNISNNFVVADDVKSLTGNTCVIFLRNICVSTTVPEGDCNRAIGIYAPYEVTSKVLEAGQYYTGYAELVGKRHHTAYKSIKNQYGEIIGVLYIGVPTAPYEAIIADSAKMAGSIGSVLALIIGGFSCLVIGRFVNNNGGRCVATDNIAKVHTQSSNRDREISQQSGNLRAENLCASRMDVTTEPELDSQLEQHIANGYETDESGWLGELLDAQKKLPKGLNRETLKQIALFLQRQAEKEITIQMVSEAVCLSRVTVRHYFDYLYECGLVEMEQKYGSVGRPLRVYKSKI